MKLKDDSWLDGIVENNAVQLGERRGRERESCLSRGYAANEFQEDCQSFKIEMDD